MRDRNLQCGILLCLAGFGPLANCEEAKGLRIRADGFRNDRGHAIAKLFQKGDSVLGHGRWELTATIQGKQANFALPELPYGAYALVVFHDENDNGVIDHNILGLPVEALGFSNGFLPGLVSGLPDFDKLRFEHTSGNKTLEIVVK